MNSCHLVRVAAFFAVLGFFGSGSATAVEVSFQGEIRSWAAVESEPVEKREAGLRYLPELTFSAALSSDWNVDGELTGNIYSVVSRTGNEDMETDQTAKAYRAWGRLFTDRAGIRLGLQEISFGPGKILRSLRWFDQKDSRDPTEFTDGVNALLFRYYFDSNANVWVWGIGANDDPMGISLLRTADDTLETGGRFQLPLGSGEMGISVHTRQAELPGTYGSRSEQLSERRIGADLSWDLGVGLYLETTCLQLQENGLIPEQQTFITLGGDYTFDIGDGLGTIVEVMGVDLQYADSTRKDGTIWFMAASGQLPLNLLDQVQVMLFHNFDNEGTTLQASWQRATDDWIFSLIAYTSRMNADSAISDQFSFTDTTGQDGIRILFQYNH